MKVYGQQKNQPQQKVSPNIRSRAKAVEASPPVHPIMRLQQRIGNQAVQRLLRANAKGLEAGSDPSAATRSAHDFTRIPVSSEAPVRLQAKLNVSAPGDVHEQEADRVAAQVTSMPERQLQRSCACGGGCPKCQKQPAAHEHLQMKSVHANDIGRTEAPPIVHEVLRSSGQPLDRATRAFMEPRFGHDFSRVRVHTDARAAESAQVVNAMAYTVGRHVVFGAMQFAPGTPTGQRLLAHELAHTLQQGNAVIRRQPVINPGKGTTDELKKEFERLQKGRSEASKKCVPRRHTLSEIMTGLACPPEVARELEQYDALIGKLQSRIAERGDTKLKGCGLKLSFNGSALLLAGEVNQSIPAVSGKPIDGKFDYSKERQEIEKTGPIPEGNYWINPDELKSLWYYPSQWLPEGVVSNAWGTHRITIHPYDQTETLGRGGFFIHGGSIAGSAGCIDLTNKIQDFATILKEFENCNIPLKVSYPQKDKPKQKK